MRKGMMQLMMIGFMVAHAWASGAGHPQLKAFPAPKQGMARFVIVLPDHGREEEKDLRGEIIVGKDMLTDGVNIVRLGSAIEPRTLKGWGYTYYEVTGSSKVMSTLMAPPQGSPQVSQFVRASPIHLVYNSRLPLVVYAPTGYEVRYRIWRASDTIGRAERG